MKKKENIEKEPCNEKRADNVTGSGMHKNAKGINLFHKTIKPNDNKKIKKN